MSVVTATISKEGQQPLSAKYRLIGIDINQELNRIPYAQLLLVDGHAASQSFPLSDDDFFTPGSKLQIDLRYEMGQSATASGNAKKNTQASIFEGLVIRHALESDGQEAILRVHLKDIAYRMTLGRKSAVYSGTDNSIITEVVNAAGLGKLADIEGAQKPDHAEMVQYNCTDWDFVLSRAEAQNLVVAVHNGKVTAKPLVEIKKTASAKKFEYRKSKIFRFELEADVGDQFAEIESHSWDLKTKEMIGSGSGEKFSLLQGGKKNNGSQSSAATSGAETGLRTEEIIEIAEAIGGEKMSLATTVPLHPDEAQAWANSRMARSRMSLFRGSFSLEGRKDLKLLDVIELEGLGTRFKGKTFITGIRHQVDVGGWQTHIQFGLPAEPFAYSPNIQESPASGLLPAVHGLQLAVVDSLAENPAEDHYRVKIKLLGVDADKTLMARLGTFDAGDMHGAIFLPHKGDEVVVGFLNDDPRQPIILGSLYSKANQPPNEPWLKWDPKNNYKGFKSKTGIGISIDDQEHLLTLLTADDRKVELKKDSIIITDTHQGKENKIVMNSQGISLETAGDVTISGNNITLNATAKVDIIGSIVNVK